MRMFNSTSIFVQKMKMNEEQQYHDRYYTQLYSLKHLCDITQIYGIMLQYVLYTQKYYISF
jgi:hypothetical protein